MNILVCGGRMYGFKFENEKKVVDKEVAKFAFGVLNKIAASYSINFDPVDNWLPTDICIISGGADGADKLAEDWAVINYCQWKTFPADWRRYGKAAGPIRNQQMIDKGKPDLVVAFPGGRGTANMIMLAKENEIPVRIIE